MLNLTIPVYSQILVDLEGASCQLTPLGVRQITCKDSTKISLTELSNTLSRLFREKGCVQTERKALKELGEKMANWFQKTDRESAQSPFYTQLLEGFVNLSDSAFWRPGAENPHIENLYSPSEWDASFPKVPRPQPKETVNGRGLYTTEQLEAAERITNQKPVQDPPDDDYVLVD